MEVDAIGRFLLADNESQRTGVLPSDAFDSSYQDQDVWLDSRQLSGHQMAVFNSGKVTSVEYLKDVTRSRCSRRRQNSRVA